MSRVSDELYGLGIVKLSGMTGTADATGDLPTVTAGVVDDVATLAAQVNLIIDALRASGVLKQNDSNG